MKRFRDLSPEHAKVPPFSSIHPTQSSSRTKSDNRRVRLQKLKVDHNLFKLATKFKKSFVTEKRSRVEDAADFTSGNFFFSSKKDAFGRNTEYLVNNNYNTYSDIRLSAEPSTEGDRLPFQLMDGESIEVTPEVFNPHHHNMEPSMRMNT
mmetsp:Transcript_19414/g.29817  ORF Transcript_19414/g.29817 Transcript_19414/m.29817 type:complete len:150 (+) Transcript_19414:2254-2703(+)